MTRLSARAILTAAVVCLVAGGGTAGASVGPPQRAIVVGDQVVPLYPVPGPAPTTHVGFVRDTNARSFTRVDQNGAPVGPAPTSTGIANGAQLLFGGFDYDQDGWPDLVERVPYPSGRYCENGLPVQNQYLRILSGRRDEAQFPVGTLPDTCTGGEPFHAWGPFHPLFGTGAELVFAPQLGDMGWVLRYSPSGGWATDSTFYQPTGPWWTHTYRSATRPNTDLSAVLNGFVTQVNGERRVVAWTTKHVMQFRTGTCPGAPCSAQLAADTRYVSGQDTACGPVISGRNYGEVIRDPASGFVDLIGGTDAWTIFSDMAHDPPVNAPLYAELDANNPADDHWGQLERHVSVYDPARAQVLDDHFVWCATASTPRSWKYWGRLVYPANPLVERNGPSRLAYNVYGDFGPGGDSNVNRWVMQITAPGSAAPVLKLRDWFLWDVRDIDGDGTDEWITSPACDPMPAEGCPGSLSDPPYLLAHKIVILHWDEASQNFSPGYQVIEDAYPRLEWAFRQPSISSSRSGLFPVFSASTPDGLELVVTRDGSATPQPASAQPGVGPNPVTSRLSRIDPAPPAGQASEEASLVPPGACGRPCGRSSPCGPARGRRGRKGASPGARRRTLSRAQPGPGYPCRKRPARPRRQRDRG